MLPVAQVLVAQLIREELDDILLCLALDLADVAHVEPPLAVSAWMIPSLTFESFSK